MTESLRSSNPGDAEGMAIIRRLAEREKDYGTLDAPVLQLGPYSTFIMICGLQLAWRHPETSAEIRRQWRDIGEQLARTFPADVQALIGLGWDPTQDRGRPQT